MTDEIQHFYANWARQCSTESLNHILNDTDRWIREGREYSTQAVDAVRVEKDRRLADPNSSDFRPTFF